jgi:hypothetical protein
MTQFLRGKADGEDSIFGAWDKRSAVKHNVYWLTPLLLSIEDIYGELEMSTNMAMDYFKIQSCRDWRHLWSK